MWRLGKLFGNGHSMGYNRIHDANRLDTLITRSCKSMNNKKTTPRISRTRAEKLLFAFLLLLTCCHPLLGQESGGVCRSFKKTNRVVLDVGEKGKFDSTQAKYPSILKVGDEWWLWYNGRTDDHFTGSVGLATSKDGLQWTKQNDGYPVFEHGLPGTFDSTKVDHPTVLRFDGKFHMWYTAGDKNSRYTIGYATSPDGIHWTRENNSQPVFGPGNPGQFDDQIVLHPAVVRDDSGLLHMWYNGVGPQESFRVGHATSREGILWARENAGRPVVEPSVVDDFEEGYVYNVFVMQENCRFHMWYSAWAPNDRKTGANHNCITHAVSPDGNSWKKDSTPTLTNGVRGSIDEYACFACSIIPRDDQWWMYYSAGSGSTSGPYRVSLAKCQQSE
jgi:predicted GH43/DUF377 family glycosyl hydrolase